MKNLVFTITMLLLETMVSGCATRPGLAQKDYEKYCAEPGPCATYLRAKILQYQETGSVVVGVMGVPQLRRLPASDQR